MSNSEARSHIYTDAGAVQAGGGLYITRASDDELLALCRGGVFTYVLTPRQLGKTSLMFNTAERLSREHIRAVTVDLSGLGVQVSAEEWYRGLLVMIDDVLALQTDVIGWWQAHAHLGRTQRLTLFFKEVLLAEVPGPLVIFVDEIDTTLGLDFTDDFYAAIRYIYQSRARTPEFDRLTFVLIGVASPADLIRDAKRTPFNIGQRVDLTDFTPDEALPLSEGLGLAPDEAAHVFGWILGWTGGHPYLTQHVCRAVAARGQRKWTKADVDDLVAETFFGERSEADHNLLFVRDMLTKRTGRAGDVLDAYRSILRSRRPVPDEEQSFVKSHLKLSGVVRREQGALRVRNPIYREVFNDAWVKSHLHVNWPKRLQRAAVGLMLTLWLLTFPLVVYAWSQRNEALRQARNTEDALRETERQRRLADESRREAERLRGIAEERRRFAENETGEVERQRRLVEAESEKAQEQRRLAESRRVEAERLKSIAEERETEADRLRHVSDARGLELKANMSLADKDDLSAYLLIANALKLDDQPDRRARLLETKLKAAPEAELVWTSPEVPAAETAEFSPDGRQLAVGTVGGWVNVFDVLSGRMMFLLNGHEGGVTAIAYGPAGSKWLASGGRDNSVRLWNLETKDSRVFEGHQSPVRRVAFSADGERLVSLDEGGGLLLTDVRAGTTRIVSPGGTEKNMFRDVMFTDDKDFIYVVSGYAELMPERKYVGPPVQTIFFDEFASVGPRPTGHISDVIFDQNHTKVATARKDGTVNWAGRTFKFGNAPVTSIDLSPDEQWLASVGKDGVLHVLERRRGQEVLKLHVSPAGLKKVSFSPRGDQIALVGEDGLVRLLSLKGREVIDLPLNQETAYAVAFSPDGRRLAGGGSKIIVLDSRTGRVERILAGHPAMVMSLAFSADGRSLLSASRDGEAALWDVEAGSVIRRVGRPPKDAKPANDSKPSEAFQEVAFTSDGRQFASTYFSDAGVVHLWDGRDGTEAMTLEQDEDVTSLCYSPNGETLAVGTVTGPIRMWDARSGKMLFKLDGHEGITLFLAFSSDGRRLASAGSDKTVRVWDLSTRKEVSTLRTPDIVEYISFSPEGQLLASGGDDRTIRLWDIQKGKEVAVLRGHESALSSFAFSTDGRRLSSADIGGSIRIWDLDGVKQFFEASPAALVKEAEYRASLRVNGLEVEAITPNTSSPYAELGGTLFEDDADENARLDNLAAALLAEPYALGYVIIYMSPDGTRERAKATGERIRKYLADTHKINDKRIVTIYGGVQRERRIELWLVPPGATPPNPSPRMP